MKLNFGVPLLQHTRAGLGKSLFVLHSLVTGGRSCMCMRRPKVVLLAGAMVCTSARPWNWWL